MVQTKVGAFLAQLRKEKNLTQGQLADKLSISPQAVSKWERGESLPDITLLPELASMYSVSVDEIVSGERNSSEVVKIKKDYSYLFSPIAGVLYGVVSLLLYIGINSFVFYYIGNYTITSFLNFYNAIFESAHYQYGNYLLLFTFIATLMGVILSIPLFFSLPKKINFILNVARNSFISVQIILLIVFICVCYPLPVGDYIMVIFWSLVGVFFWLVPWLNPFISSVYQRRK